MTIRLLALYQGNPPNTIVTLATGTENALVAAGNATTDLSGGVPPSFTVAPPVQVGDVLYGADGVPLGIADPAGKLISPFTGIAAPGAPTGLTLTPIAGGVLAAFTPSATLGGTATIGFEVTLSNGRVQRGTASPIVINSPAGAVTATVKQINGAGLSAASAASASATVTAYSAPALPGAPTGLTLTAGNGKVTATWTAAASNGSALRNTIVTLSNGATAVAAGGATSIDVSTPNGIAVTATARAANGEGQGPVSAVSNSVTPVAAPAKVLRFATTNNRVLDLLSSPVNGNTEFHFCTPYFVGSGDLEQLVLSCSNTIASGVLTTLGDWTIEKMAVQNADFTATYPVTFNGSRSKVIAPGVYDVQADPLLPTAQLPLTRGSKFWVKGKCVRVDTKQTSGATGRASNATGQLTGSVNPANSTVSDIDALGKQTVTSGAAFTAAGSSNWCPIALGTYKSASEPLVPFGIGDSNLFGFGDTALSLDQGYGTMQRALAGDNTAGQLLSGGNFSITGRTIAALTTDYQCHWAKYANLLIEQPGGNSFLGAATGAQVTADTEALITKLRTFNPTARMLRLDIGPHTTGAWTLADQSDQTVISPQYVTGGPVEVWRANLRAKVGQPNGYYAYIDFPLWRSGPDPLKWVADGTAGKYTTDGTHGTSVIEADKGATLRTAMLAAFAAA